jgi:hypothetical protein
LVDERRGKDGEGFYIRTFTGKQFHFDKIEQNEIDIRDLAHALAARCRWSGHTSQFYSIAQHCVLAARKAPKKFKLAALLHDGNEAYLPDFPSPLKWHLRDEGVEAIRELERRTDAHIYSVFGLPFTAMPPEVKTVDQRLLATEHRDLMPTSEERTYMDEPYSFTIKPWSPQKAEKEYLKMYEKLRGLDKAAA